MKTIIVPTDFSDSAWIAFQFALQLAKKNNLEILVINSFREPHLGTAHFVSLEQILREDSKKGLREWEQRIKNEHADSELTIKFKSVYGSLVDVLKMNITNKDDHIIVMGSLGETGFMEKFIGSNSSNVVDNIECPIFIIPSNTKNTLPNNLAVAANFIDNTQSKELNILSHLNLINSTKKINVVHISKVDNSEDIDLSKDNFFMDNPYALHLISDDDISKGLSKYVLDSKIDLLVLIKEKKGLIERIFNESITKELTLSAEIPLLILKPSY